MKFKSLVYLALFSLISIGSHSQNNERFKNLFGGGSFQYGFVCGVTTERFQADQSQELIHTLITTPHFEQFGFNLGIDFRARLNKSLSIRIQPSLALDRKMYNTLVFNDLTPVKVDRNFVNVPLHWMFHSKNTLFRFYGFAGVRWSYDISTSNEILLLPYNTGVFFPFKRHDLSAEVGFGYKFQLGRFTVAPEFTASAGLLDQTGTSQYAPQDSEIQGYSHRLMFSLVFHR